MCNKQIYYVIFQVKYFVLNFFLTLVVKWKTLYNDNFLNHFTKNVIILMFTFVVEAPCLYYVCIM